MIPGYAMGYNGFFAHAIELRTPRWLKWLPALTPKDIQLKPETLPHIEALGNTRFHLSLFKNGHFFKPFKLRARIGYPSPFLQPIGIVTINHDI